VAPGAARHEPAPTTPGRPFSARLLAPLIGADRYRRPADQAIQHDLARARPGGAGGGVGVAAYSFRMANGDHSPGSEADGAPASTDPATMGYEQARDELLAVATRLESGVVSLEESLLLWERGEALAERCQAWLDTARARLDAARDDNPGPAGAAGDTA
jgi:exodeoxyribonuclease VII small subunit